MARRHYVAAIAVVLDGDDVLVAEHRFRSNRWALPGGWVHRLEDPARACEREVAEELGLDVRAIAVVAVDVHAVDGRPIRYGGLSIAYRCVLTNESSRDVVQPSIEISGSRWIERSDWSTVLSGFELNAVRLADSMT